MSLSCSFGTAKQLKSRLAAEICSILAFSAIRNNDRVGLIIFTDRIEKFVPPRKGLSHVLRVIREALYFKPKGSGTNIKAALEYLGKVTTRKTVTFIISDFYNPAFKKDLSITNKRHDTIAVTITDPLEIELPNIGIIRLDDPETGESRLIDTSRAALRKDYHKNSLQRFQERKKLFQSINVDSIDIRTDIPYSKTLIAFFKMRERRIH